MQNKKGFTLVELLVVIVILGIITGISIPLIRNIQAKNEERQYKTYQDSLKYSAKLYVDSYREDLFGHSKSGCAIITYDQMVEKGLLKDITIGDVSCDTNRTLVRAVMFDDKVSYTPMIGCGKVVGGEVEVETILPKNGIGDFITCGANVQTIIAFDSTPRSSDSINYKRRNITVKLNSYTGFYENMEIYYTFVNKNTLGGINPTLINTDESASVPPEPTNIIEGWPKLEIDYIGGNEQKRLIENGDVVTLSSKEIRTPVNLTGDYYLVLRIENLQDLSGRSWTSRTDRGKYVYLGSYKVDNTKPVFSNDSTVISSSTGYNNLKPKLKTNVTDVYSTSDTNRELRMCISYDSDDCSKKVSDIKNKENHWVTYDGNAVLEKIKNTYDGTNHTVYVSVGDAAGNYTTKNYSYKLATRYTLTYDSNGGVDCNPSSKSVTSDTANPKWGNLCTPTRDHYVFREWNTKKDGSGTTITKDSTASGNITVYAQWSLEQFTVKLVAGEGISEMKLAGSTTVLEKKFDYNTTVNYEVTKVADYYRFNKWDNGTTTKAGSVKVTKDITLTATTLKNGIKIHYYTNGGTLTASPKQVCPQSVTGCSGVCEQTTNYGGCTGNATGLVVENQKYQAFDATGWASDGIRDYKGYDLASIYMKRTAYAATGNWLIGSATSTNKVNESTLWPTAKDFAIAVGLGEQMKTKDVDVNLYAEWKATGVPAYSVLKVGDYVDYHSYIDAKTFTPTWAQTGVNNHPTQSTNTSVKWRVLYVNTSSKVVWLHPATAPNRLLLREAQGYINGPGTMHAMAKALYSSSTLGLNAKNMTIEDLETALGSGAVSAKTNSYVEGVRYGTTQTFTSKDKFIASAVSGGTDNGAISGTNDRYLRASSGSPITAKQSVFKYDPSTINSTAAEVLGNETGWYATRGLVLQNNSAGHYVGFCLIEGKRTETEAIDMVDSNGYVPQDHDGGPYGINIHPMVVLPATIYVKEGTYGTSSNPWKITQLN